MQRFARFLLVSWIVSLGLPNAAVTQQFGSARAEWTTPIAPFRMTDNIYYVGSKDLAAYLIVTPAGVTRGAGVPGSAVADAVPAEPTARAAARPAVSTATLARKNPP